MAKDIAQRLAELGVELPDIAPAVANYVPVVRAGHFLFVSGQLPMREGKLAYAGRVGETLTAEEGAEAARLCAVNLLAQVRAALDGDLDRVERIVRLGGFVASAPDFTAQPQVIDGASDLLVELFGGAGRHARAAVGVNVLPLGSAVEVEAIVEVA